jgi:hypothetical protein
MVDSNLGDHITRVPASYCLRTDLYGLPFALHCLRHIPVSAQQFDEAIPPTQSATNLATPRGLESRLQPDGHRRLRITNLETPATSFPSQLRFELGRFPDRDTFQVRYSALRLARYPAQSEMALRS